MQKIFGYNHKHITYNNMGCLQGYFTRKINYLEEYKIITIDTNSSQTLHFHSTFDKIFHQQNIKRKYFTYFKNLIFKILTKKVKWKCDDSDLQMFY